MRLARFAPLLLLAAAALAQCGPRRTELVVVVDTDIDVPAGLDAFDITIESEGFSQEKHADLGATSALPVTLGVVAGSNPRATVTIIATGSKDAKEKVRSIVRTTLIPEESRLVHLSLCRSCNTACGERTVSGAELPVYEGNEPRSHACSAEPIADAGADTTEPNDAASDVTIDQDAATGPPLVAAYDFEETNGATVIDRSGNGRDGAITGNVAAVRSTGRNGQGRGLLFHRVPSDTFQCNKAEPALRAASTGAISFWFRDDDDTSPLTGSAGYFDNQTTTRNHFFVYRFRDDPPGSLHVTFQLASDGGADFPARQPFSTTIGTWTRFVLSWGSQKAKVLVGNATTPVEITYAKPWAATTQECSLSKDGTARAAFDDLKIYARELTDEEMAQVP